MKSEIGCRLVLPYHQLESKTKTLIQPTKSNREPIMRKFRGRTVEGRLRPDSENMIEQIFGHCTLMGRSRDDGDS